MTVHSRFGASGATRFMNCPGSIYLSSKIPERPSKYAQEGTEAHRYAEELLFKEEFDRFEYSDDAMVSGAKIYRDHIHSILSQTNDFRVYIEKLIKLDFIDPELFGTADCIIEDYDNSTLHVIDFKYGKTMVDPNCDQLKFYATGACYQKPFKKIVLTIVQPRGRNVTWDKVRSYETDKVELTEFALVLQTAVAKIKDGDQTLVKGRYCFFCKGREICPLLIDEINSNAKNDFSAI